MDEEHSGSDGIPIYSEDGSRILATMSGPNASEWVKDDPPVYIEPKCQVCSKSDCDMQECIDTFVANDFELASTSTEAEKEKNPQVHNQNLKVVMLLSILNHLFPRMSEKSSLLPPQTCTEAYGSKIQPEWHRFTSSMFLNSILVT